MKKYRNTSFLIELMVNVLVLSISCAVLVNVLVNAFLIVKNTGSKNNAGNEIASLLQQARVRGLESLEAEEADGGLVLYYDADWNRTDGDGAKYVLTFTVEAQDTGAGELQSITAVAHTAAGQQLCEFNTALYVPGGEVAV